MFRSILDFWKGRDFLDQVLEDFSRMLIDAEEIYRMVVDALKTGAEMQPLGDRVYEIDRQINKREMEIRRRIVEHMTVQPHADLRFSLVLMSVVKDAERLGDYVKNLFEVFELHDGPLDANQLRKYFGDLPDQIGELFRHTHEAFVESNEDTARQVIGDHSEMMKRCNEILAHVCRDESLSVNDAVCLAMLARFLKRVTAHLGNIATSVVVPVDRLDYFDERRDPPQ
ncbi:MAG: phosphate uptake regulator PhoU [Candidatus Krumholzibacteriia bacterium]